MHALTKGFEYKKAKNHFCGRDFGRAGSRLGERSPLLFSNEQPDLSRGIHSCLFNNAWGTNYIMWYGEDARFRYVIKG